MRYKNASKICLFLLTTLMVACTPKADKLTILHTNDTHSQIEPIAEGKRDGNHAGYARRMGLETLVKVHHISTSTMVESK